MMQAVAPISVPVARSAAASNAPRRRFYRRVLRELNAAGIEFRRRISTSSFVPATRMRRSTTSGPSASRPSWRSRTGSPRSCAAMIRST